MSPFSVQNVLALLYYGAGPPTSAIMGVALKFGNDSTQTIANEFQDVLGPLRNNQMFSIANGVYINQLFSYQTSYAVKAKQYFSANVQSINFANTVKAVNTINGWVSTGTNGKITKVIDMGSVDGSTEMVLINALYFNGIWKHQFTKYPNNGGNSSFYAEGCTGLKNNGTEQRQMMYVTVSLVCTCTCIG